MGTHKLSDKQINQQAITAKQNGASPQEIAAILRASSPENQRAFIKRMMKHV